jgi:hypothetical protein
MRKRKYRMDRRNSERAQEHQAETPGPVLATPQITQQATPQVSSGGTYQNTYQSAVNSTPQNDRDRNEQPALRRAHEPTTILQDPTRLSQGIASSKRVIINLDDESHKRQRLDVRTSTEASSPSMVDVDAMNRESTILNRTSVVQTEQDHPNVHATSQQASNSTHTLLTWVKFLYCIQ